MQNIKELEIETERLLIKPYNEMYLEEYYRGFTEEVTKYQYPDSFASLEQARKTVHDFVQAMERQEMYELVILTKNGKFLGSMEVFDIRRDVPEVGLWLIKSVHKMGYGFEALKGLFAFLDSQKKYKEYIYEADERNAASIALVSKFSPEKGDTQKIITESGKTLYLTTYRIKAKPWRECI